MSEWMLVPKVANDAMLDHGHWAIVSIHATGQFGECPGVGWGHPSVCWDAMLASAPAPTADDIQAMVTEEIMGKANRAYRLFPGDHPDRLRAMLEAALTALFAKGDRG